MQVNEVYLDRQIGGSEEQQSARELFNPNVVRITAKYALTPDDIWITIILAVSANLITSVLNEGIKQIATIVTKFMHRHEQKDHRLCASVIQQAESIKYEIRFVVGSNPDEYYKELKQSIPSSKNIHPDASRVVIDLVSMWVRTLDETGLLIEERKIPCSHASESQNK